jgi:HlyD family secretion protein
MKKHFQNIKTFAFTHKKISIAIFLAVLYVGYWGYGKLTDTSGETRYVMAAVSKGTIISSVSGSGQVSASNQVDIKAKASGDITYIGVTAGQTVKAGALIAQIDTTDAQKAVRDAQVNLETAKLSYEKLVAPADALSSLQWQNNIAKAKESRDTAVVNLQKSYDDGFTAVASIFLDLPTVLTGLNDLLYSNNTGLGGSSGQQNIDFYTAYAKMNESVIGKADQYRTDANTKYQDARVSYDAAFLAYKSANRSSSTSTIEALIAQTYETTKKVSDAVKSSNDLIMLYKDQMTLQNTTVKATADTHLATLSSYTNKTNSYLSSLFSSTNAIANNKSAIVNVDRTIAENTLSFQKFEAGADTLDIRNSNINIAQKENALADARTALADCYARAQFDGMIAKINVKKGDAVSNGTAVATLVTKQQIATLSMNEVDVAKIKIDQKATLTFDAVEGLTITGKVVEVDTIGTVTQGVATYNVKIAFDTQDERVKPGMSVSATIISAVKTDVLMVVNSAVKTSATDETSYIEMFETPPADATNSAGVLSLILPKQITITLGISNDTETEIVTGVKEGDLVITRSTTGAQATAAKAATAPSLFGGGTGARNIGR